MPVPSSADRAARSIGRRALFAGAGGTVGALLLGGVSGCTSSDEPAATSTAPAAPDPLTGLIATTRLHLLRLDAAITADPADAARLTPLRADRQAHLDALIAERDRVTPPTSTGPTADPAPADLRLPEDPAAIISTVRGDAATAQVQFTDAMSAVGPYRAALLGSIVACLASHRAVLA
ncbi:hypothetical protein [Nakamurella leprariae]|uniref:Uncharacterized protein n=1 Tax=Nakamurella leprariae TaxID=2803911 RepID=A0A938Y9W8_9ACTN|nr:hypothetical protein [Nakamurella leprariae]MBM9465874.1 hypothetical protein [Nakamurella leprariae]